MLAPDGDLNQETESARRVQTHFNSLRWSPVTEDRDDGIVYYADFFNITNGVAHGVTLYHPQTPIDPRHRALSP